MNLKLFPQFFCCFLLCFACIPFLLIAQVSDWQLIGLSRQQVSEIDVDPIDDNILYAGIWQDFDTTSLYKSYDKGVHWMPLSIRARRVSSIAIDPMDNKRIYIGFWNLRPLRSEDGGLSWTEIPLGSYWASSYFTVDPNNPNIIYFIHATSPEDINTHKSTNFGQTWQDISPSVQGWSQTCPVAIHSKNGNIVYSKTYCLFKSIDQGYNWRPIDYNFLNMEYIFLHQEHPDTIYIADPAIGSDYKKGSLFISHDGGDSWIEIGPFDSRIIQIISNPLNSDILYLAAGKEILKSTDAGMNWEKIKNGNLDATIWSIALSHDGHILYAATDSGLFKKDLTTAIEQQHHFLPEDFILLQNYPNPFNSMTKIIYRLRNPCHVSLQIYNMRGELVTTLINADQKAREHQMSWDGRNDSGQPVAAGIYICRLRSREFNKSIRLVLLR